MFMQPKLASYHTTARQGQPWGSQAANSKRPVRQEDGIPKLANLRKLVLSWLPKSDLTKKHTVSGLNPGVNSQKPFVDFGWLPLPPGSRYRGFALKTCPDLPAPEK
jgi:hypothetical protein